MTLKDKLVMYRKPALLLLLIILSWILVQYHENRIQSLLPLLGLIVAASSSFVTYLSTQTPSIRIELQDPKYSSLDSPFILQNLSKVGGSARVWVTLQVDGKEYPATELRDELYYSGRASWSFSGKDSIVGHFDFAKLALNNHSSKTLRVRIDVQWYTSFGLPVDKLTRYWIFDNGERVWKWVLDVGGAEYYPNRKPAPLISEHKSEGHMARKFSTPGEALRNKPLYLVFSICYFALGLYTIYLCSTWQPNLKIYFPTDIAGEDARQLIWCFSWNALGFAMIAFRTATDANEHRNPVVRYLTLYPAFLTVNSFLIFGFLRAFVPNASTPLVFYSLGMASGMYLGFRIDRVLDFNPTALLKK